MAVTRSLFRAQVAQVVDAVPYEIWIKVLSNLEGKDIGRAVCVCKTFASLQDPVWQAACENRWPELAVIARAPETRWQRQYELLEQRELASLAKPCKGAILKRQPEVNARHRLVLTEWLAEVSWEFGLESSALYKAVSYLDYYLSENAVDLKRFQLLGIACLRAAVFDSEGELAGDLAPQRCADISDKAYTAQDVETETAKISASIPAHIKAAPNSKMFLRGFWFQAVKSDSVSVDKRELHIYNLASFLLQLSLLDLECSEESPSLVAAAALSTAFDIFAKESWPAALTHFSTHTAQEMSTCKANFVRVQSSVKKSNLRHQWLLRQRENEFPEYKSEWSVVKALMAGCADS